MICYKVIDDDYKMLRSFADHLGDYKIKYSLNNWTYPNKGKLFVFKAFGDAKKFTPGTNFPIYSCEVKNARPFQKMVFNTHSNYDDFWNLYEEARKKKVNIAKYLEKNYKGQLMSAPIGTYACDAVKLLERSY